MGDSDELIERARRLLVNAAVEAAMGEVWGGERACWRENAELKAAAPELVSGLLAEVERLRGELAARSDTEHWCSCPPDVCRGIGPDAQGCSWCWAKDEDDPCPNAAGSGSVGSGEQ